MVTAAKVRSLFPALVLLVTLLSAYDIQAQASGGRDTLRPGDILEVRVWPDSAMNGRYPIEESGEVSLPFVGRVAAAGRTPREIRDMLQIEFGEVLRTPVVTVIPRFNVSVWGGVERPGLYTVDPTVTLLDLISLAGGFGEDAKEDEVELVRGGRVIQVDAEQVMRDPGSLDSLRLQSGDRVVVPESRFGFQRVLVALQSVSIVISLVNLFTR